VPDRCREGVEADPAGRVVAAGHGEADAVQAPQTRHRHRVRPSCPRPARAPDGGSQPPQRTTLVSL